MDGGGPTVSSRKSAASDGAVVIGTWQHVTWNYVTADNNDWKIYLNGVEKTITSISGAGGSVGYGSNKGAIGAVRSFFFDGKISLVQFYNRTLSTSEILNNYNSQKTRFGL